MDIDLNLVKELKSTILQAYEEALKLNNHV